MDYLKFKLAFGRHPPKSRLNNYSSSGDLADHELSGILPNKVDFKLGTPSLCDNKEEENLRKENITLVLSNSSSKEIVLLELKWRPQEDGQVVLISKLKLSIDNKVYEFEQAEVYKPTRSSLYPDCVMQYGSKGSSLKLFILLPHRKMRLVFRDHMRPLNGSGESKFIKLNLIISATAPIYDFLRQYNQECFKALYTEKKPKLSIEDTMKNLLFHDRHEHPVRADGEYIIHEDGQTKIRSKVILWGFHARHFITNGATTTEVKRSKRILAHLINGQLFHIGNISSNEDDMDFGYTCLEVRFGMLPIDKPFFINWEKVEENADEFELEVNGEGRTFDCKAKRRQPEVGQFFDIEMNDKPGYAWVQVDNAAADSTEELDRLQHLVEEHRKLMEEGRLIHLPIQFQQIDKQPLVVSITDPQCTYSDLVGSKASSLALLHKFSERKLLNAGDNFTVPHAFVVTRYAYDAILSDNNELNEQTKKLESLIADGQLDGLQQECERIQKAIESSALIESVRLDLTSKLEQHYGHDKLDTTLFAVRSSSWGEDEEDMSAAGQLRTILGVRGLEAITKAVMSCFGSKYTYANIEYKRQHGLGPNLPMAVVVQEMVGCEKAGVLFTCDPTSGDPRCLTITANYGLGESVVSGQSDPDSILVRVQPDNMDTLSVEDVKIGEKKVIIDSESLLNGDQNEQHSYDRSIRCISHEEILRLARCGLALAKYYECPCDIEWGYKGDQLYLFQSRPITSLDAYTEHELLHEADTPTTAELDFYSRANIGEVVPYAIKPFTISFYMAMWQVFGAQMVHKLDSRTDRLYWPGGSSYEILYLCYHNLFKMRGSSLFPMMDPEQEKPLMLRAMEVSFFGHEIDPQPELIEASKGFTKPENLFQGQRYDLYTMSLKLMPTSVIMREKVATRKARVDIRNLKYAEGHQENRMMGLLRQMRCLYRLGSDPWENHIIIIMLTQANNAALSGQLAKYIKDPVQLFTAMSKILGNSPNVISAEIPKRIDSMARLIRSKGQEKLDAFLKLTDQEALQYLKDATQNEQLAKEFDEFLDRFGHRCYNEFELAEQSWRENPSLIVEMLRQNCVNPKLISDDDDRSKPMSLEQIVDSLNLDLSFKDRALLKYVIGPKSQNLVASRERTKDILVDQADLNREATRMLAKEMRRQLRLPDEDLFYYLFYHELEPLIREPQPALVVQATRRRQMFKRMFKETWKFDEIIKGPDLVPNHLRPNKELDAALANAPKLHGTPASCGKVQAKVSLVMNYGDLDKVRQGDILVTYSTDIGFSPVFPLLAGIITEVGGLISHGAVVAREYGLPSVLGIPDVTRILTDGEEIILDADNGVIIRLNK